MTPNRTHMPWWYPFHTSELDSNQNAIVAMARRFGFSEYFPPTQSQQTVAAAIRFLGFDAAAGYTERPSLLGEIAELAKEIDSFEW